MLHLRENTQNDIDSCMVRITEMFAAQCRDGAQTLALKGAVACGQFIGDAASTIPQRGVHGTAAALRVLSASQPNHNGDLVTGLVKYLVDRDKCEKAVLTAQVPNQTAAKPKDDEGNIIKQAETLLALAAVPNSIKNTQKLKNTVAKGLLASRQQDGGWGYFDGDSKTELLPTAWAMLALSHSAEDVTEQASYLKLGLKNGNTHGSRNDLMSRVFALYALVFQKKKPTVQENTEFVAIFVDLWQQLESSMTEDIEQNIEYWRKDETFYVRIPYQLYLISLSARLRWRVFASRPVQDRLGAILLSTQHGGFSYPHSGAYVSARTSAILFETLGHVSEEMRKMRLFWPMYAFDKIRRFLGNRHLRTVVWLVVVVLIASSCYSWYHDPTSSFADLAPDLVSNALLV